MKLHIKVASIPMAELAQIRQATGRSFLVELTQKGEEALDEVMTAGLVWIMRKRTQPELEFSEVFATLTPGEVMRAVVFDLGEEPKRRGG